MKLVKVPDLSVLRRGDVVQNKGSGISYVVTETHPVVVVVRTLTIINASEWQLVKE
jgi:hypothetical protein